MTTEKQLRVAPKVWIGVVVYLAYLAVFYGVWIVNGIEYDRIGDSAETVLKWYAMPTVAGAVVLVIAVTALGWWRPSIVEERRVPRILWILPGVTVAAALLQLVTGDLSRIDGTMWLYLVIGSLGVGFSEEMATRGQLIPALRSRFGERGVWLVSTLLFAALHIPNGFFGSGLAVLAQLPLTFLAGTLFYLTRKVSGSLVVAMAVHAFWDFTTFASGGGVVSAALNIVAGVVAVIVAIVLFRKPAKEPVAA